VTAASVTWTQTAEQLHRRLLSAAPKASAIGAALRLAGLALLSEPLANHPGSAAAVLYTDLALAELPDADHLMEQHQPQDGRHVELLAVRELLLAVSRALENESRRTTDAARALAHARALLHLTDAVRELDAQAPWPTH
jgi:hypothetical protein